jgi:hypothetical protein
MATPYVISGSKWRVRGIVLAAVTAVAAGVATATCVSAEEPTAQTQAPPPAQAGRGQTKPPPPNPASVDAKTLGDFMVRVKEYVALHQKHESTLPSLPKETTPEIIDRHQRALSALMLKARAGAKQGDIISPAMADVVRQTCRRAFSREDGKNMIAMIMDENPVGLKLSVNGRYPDEVPLSTMPPDLLAALPKLPEELEYRFVGDRLILLDVHAHTVVDWVENVLPLKTE